MLPVYQEKTDVLVVGAGIAGIMAALEAAKQGCTVTLVSSGATFSGSSFYPGTWGLGLVGPANQADEADLSATIQAVGCNMADPALVTTFVQGIAPAIQQVRQMGIRLRRAENADQKDFIPCFDHKHRDWNGIEFDSAREVLSAELDRLGVTLLPHCRLQELCVENGRVHGAVMLMQKQLCYLPCGSLVLATGGFGGLFRYHLNTDDVLATGQYLALKAGARLVNMEFMQMMPGYISPSYKTIFNEKAFRYSIMPKKIPQEVELLEKRSTHGPYTTRLPSRIVDEALFTEFLADSGGVPLSYCAALQQEQPEFIKAYFDWLWEKKKLTPSDQINIGIFAHASNGGIAIDSDCATGVQGLFACGECTGGMHGADRIGGLSTANGLVFGIRAGVSAAQYSTKVVGSSTAPSFAPLLHPNPQGALQELREVMFQSAMILRNEQGIVHALAELSKIEQAFVNGKADDNTVAQSAELAARIGTAKAVLLAAQLRRESRGSHNRTDYPQQDTASAHRIEVALVGGELVASYKNKEEYQCL